jgi:hypothetical protein
VRTIPEKQMGRKRSNRGAVALDARQQQIHVGDMVMVTEGPFRVRTTASSLSPITLRLGC